jgi:hypothetical protein
MADYTVFYQAQGPKIPDDPVSRADIEHVKEFGYVILENVFTLEEAHEAKAEIARLSGQSPLKGRNVFEGLDTNRIYSLLNKYSPPLPMSTHPSPHPTVHHFPPRSTTDTPPRSRVFDKFTILPRVLALNDYFLDPGYQLTAFHTIQINPGETPQELHCDDAFCNFPRPRGPLGTAIMVAFDPFTAVPSLSPFPAPKLTSPPRKTARPA